MHFCSNTIWSFEFMKMIIKKKILFFLRKPQNLQRNVTQISPYFTQTKTPVQAKKQRNKRSYKAGSLTLCRSPVSAVCIGNVHACFFFFTSSNKPHNLGEGDTTTPKLFTVLSDQWCLFSKPGVWFCHLSRCRPTMQSTRQYTKVPMCCTSST